MSPRWHRVAAPEQMDLDRGLRLQQIGMTAAEIHGKSWVEAARLVADRLLLQRGTVTSDDVVRIMPDPPHPNAVGSIFRDRRYCMTGQYVLTARPSGHARRIAVWRDARTEAARPISSVPTSLPMPTPNQSA